MFFLNKNVLEVFNNETAELESRVEEYNFKLVSAFQKANDKSLMEAPELEQEISTPARTVFKKAA